MRSLSPEEAELWAQVAATIRPLSRKLSEPAAPEQQGKPPNPEPSAKRGQPSRQKPAPPHARPRPSLPATLDGSWDRRLQSGAVDPDRTIDLHGHTLDRAWTAIDLGLERAIAAGERVILLITGHARTGEPPIKRGRIRAAVHDWLDSSRHARSIAAVRGAHRRHGGGGSLYIILRRAR